jgi:benzoyl-CoA reductase subunit B
VRINPVETKLQYKDVARNSQKDLLTGWYERITNAREDGRPLAYVFIQANICELLRSFGFEVVLPEINAVQCGIRKVSGDYILLSEDLGHSSDVCAYLKNDVGLMMKGGEGPGWTVPKPDLLLCTYAGCATYVKWFEAVSRMYDVPIFFLDVPFYQDEDIPAEEMSYVMGQLQELIEVCEKITGRKYDRERFSEITELSRQAEDLWVEILQRARNRPSPFDAFFEAVFFMAPIFTLRGTQDCVDYYRKTLTEMDERIEQGIGPLPEERFRVVMEGPAPWPHFRSFWELFKKWGVVSVASSYTKVGGTWDTGFRHDPDKPLESTAQYSFLCMGNFSMSLRTKMLERYMREYSAEGLIIHSVKSCRSYSVGQADMREDFIKNKGVPTLLIESDLVDPRYFQEAQLRNRIDAFFELMAHRKALRTGE